MEKRVRDILRATDEMLRRIERWLSDPRRGPILPEDVGLGIRAAALICDTGKIPTCCLDLAMVAVPRLAEELRGYVERDLGKVYLETGAPTPGFWAAAKAVAKARAAADDPAIAPLEPVADLLRQGVSSEQIARHIYGRRGAGPFLQSNGAPDAALIEQEAIRPGSVITSQWIPPWHQALLERRRRALTQRLQTFDQQELDRKYDDPATVEELLRDGAFIQQIERVKGVSRADVLETARRIGVAAVDGPGLLQSRFQENPNDPADDDDEAASTADRQAVKGLVIDLYTASDGARGATEIATEVRKLGHAISTNVVGAIIGHWKKKNTSTAPR